MAIGKLKTLVHHTGEGRSVDGPDSGAGCCCDCRTLYVGNECCEKTPQILFCRFVGQITLSIELLARIGDHKFGLLHVLNVKRNEYLPQMILGASGSEYAG